MKFLKILIAFVIFAGGIFLAVNWNKIFSSSGRHGSEAVNHAKIDRRCAAIRSEWAKAPGWDNALYQKHYDDAEGCYKTKLLNYNEYQAVRSALRQAAIHTVDSIYRRSLVPELYKHENVVKAYNGVKELEKREKGSGNDGRIKKVKEIHNVYTKVYAFGNPPQIMPKFDMEAAQWVAFDQRVSGVMNTAASYRSDKVYNQYLKSVPGFASKLDEKTLSQNLSKQRERFNARLTTDIYKQFDAAERSPENLDKLNRVWDRLCEQITNMSQLSSIRNLMSNWNSKD